MKRLTILSLAALLSFAFLSLNAQSVDEPTMDYRDDFAMPGYGSQTTQQDVDNERPDSEPDVSLYDYGNSGYDPEDMMIWPNPASYVVHVNVPDDFLESRVRILDYRGHISINQAGTAGQVLPIDVTGLPPGLYVVEILDTTPGGNKTRGLLGHFIRE